MKGATGNMQSTWKGSHGTDDVSYFRSCVVFVSGDSLRRNESRFQ